MPTRRCEHREPTHDLKEIRPLLKDLTQIQYEIIRPVLLMQHAPCLKFALVADRQEEDRQSA